MNMGFLTINALDKNGGLSNPATSIQRSMDGSHWSAPDHVFGEATVEGMSEAKSDHDYVYKTDFKFFKENKEFERQICFDESNTFGIYSYCYKHYKRKDITF